MGFFPFRSKCSGRGGTAPLWERVRKKFFFSMESISIPDSSPTKNLSLSFFVQPLDFFLLHTLAVYYMERRAARKKEKKTAINNIVHQVRANQKIKAISLRSLRRRTSRKVSSWIDFFSCLTKPGTRNPSQYSSCTLAKNNQRTKKMKQRRENTILVGGFSSRPPSLSCLASRNANGGREEGKEKGKKQELWHCSRNQGEGSSSTIFL